MSSGQGGVLNFLRKQKLKIRSSTKGEFVDVDDILVIFPLGKVRHRGADVYCEAQYALPR